MRLVLLCLVLALTMTACGSKGPLYIPEKQYPQGNPNP
ncbi:MAG: lipoprotein [Methylobacillus sp.]|nr:lipoprotein [Methylobacillus sp.]